MKKSTHFYSLNSEWHYQLAHEKERNVLNREIVFLPETLGQGKSYFTQITSGIFVLFLDFTLTSPIKIDSLKSENDFYIFHFDLSEKTNLIKIHNIDYKTGSPDGPGLAVLSSDAESSFRPATGERTLVLRLLIDKKMLHEFIKNYPNEGNIIRKMALNKKPLRHYNTIDSASILLMESIKKKSYTEALFDSYLKGVSLKLLGNFLSRYSNSKNERDKISDVEKKAIIRTKEYLVKNLYGAFPSITLLSKMARMSPSRYILLFKLEYGATPNNFFTKQKMLLSNKLLKSGNYNSLTEVMYELNYNRLNYFSSKYYVLFNRKPADDFVKKANIRL